MDLTLNSNPLPYEGPLIIIVTVDVEVTITYV